MSLRGGAEAIQKSLKKIIIIAGSCSGKSNWFDQINYYKNLGYEVNFMEIDAGGAASLLDASSNLFLKLKYKLKEPAVIVSHSMGAMLLLKILSEPKFYVNENQELYQNIIRSRLIFLQVPLHVNALILGILDIVKYLIAPILFLYSLIVFPVIDFILVIFKYLLAIIDKLVSGLFLKYPSWILLKPLNLLFNFFLVVNTFWGTKPKEFFNVIKFYRQWRDFALDGFFANEQVGNAFDKAMMGAVKNTMFKFDRSNARNYFFTHGFTDVFCDPGLIQRFAKQLGANLLALNYGFHSPQHCFWHQEAINNLVLD